MPVVRILTQVTLGCAIGYMILAAFISVRALWFAYYSDDRAVGDVENMHTQLRKDLTTLFIGFIAWGILF